MVERTPFFGGFLKETRVVYPLQVDSWEAEGERTYDIAELGASVRYRSPDFEAAWIDLFFYPVGVVPASHLDIALQGALDDIRSNIGREGGYSSADLGPVHAFEVPVTGQDVPPLQARSVDMSLQTADSGSYHSALVLLIDRMYHVKGRYSIPAGAEGRRGVRQRLERFVAEVVPRTVIASTGECWSPAPIEALPPAAADPTDSRLSMTSDDGGGAWLVGDRVLARDPSSPAAQLVAILAMSLDERMYAGCVGRDPENPDVPEGFREIRFEYRAPSTGPAGVRRLRPSRSGVG